MATTYTADEFRRVAADMQESLAGVQSSLRRFLEAGDRLLAMASSDDNGGLPRLGFAVREEVDSLMGAFREQVDPDDVVATWTKDVADLCELVDLALAESKAVLV